MTPPRPILDEHAEDVDALVEEWTVDSALARDRTVQLIRGAHMATGPLVVVACLVFLPGGALTVAGVAYLLGLVGVLGFVKRTSQVGWLGLFDLLLISVAAATDPLLWLALLVPTVAAVTAGWLVSARVTWGLFVVSAVGTGVAGLLTRPEGWVVIWVVYLGTQVSLHRNNVEILGRRRAGVLRVTDLVDSLPVVVWESDPESGQLTRTLGRVESLVGISPIEWRQLPVERRIHPDDLDSYLRGVETARETDHAVVHEFRLVRGDGSSAMVRQVLRRVAGTNGVLLRGVILDIADEVAAREAVERLAAVIENQTEPLAVLAPRPDVAAVPVVVQVNPALARLAGVDAAEMAGRELSTAMPWLPGTVRADLDDHQRTGRTVDREEVEIDAPDASRTFDYAVVGLPDGSAAIQFRDVTDRRAATDLIRHQAFHDPLTELPNRTLLFDRLSHALATIGRGETSVGLLLMDLDQFKEINDTLGHGYGDDLLVVVADRLSLLTRDSDTVARLGGDEFAMVVAGADENSLTEIAERVAAAVKAPVKLGGIDVEVAASIGGAVSPVHGDDPHLLLQRADVAMYDAKRSGRSFHLYEPDDDRHSRERLALMGELRQLLDGELELWFQPKIDLRTGAVAELEALARWQHPERGLLAPAHFIELCEVSGLIGELTFRVLDRAIETMVSWPDVRVAINVPVRNLYSRRLPEQIADRLATAGLDPGRLIIEITEREIMEDHRAVVEVLEELDGLGTRISIDDFGTGFSSLTHLRRLPISEIKIDQSFIGGMLDRENDYIIARSIIDLAHNLGRRVVAEGVEDTATLDLLRGLGCDAAQGFLFGRPGPAVRIRNLIDAGPALDGEGVPAWGPPP